MTPGGRALLAGAGLPLGLLLLAGPVLLGCNAVLGLDEAASRDDGGAGGGPGGGGPGGGGPGGGGGTGGVGGAGGGGGASGAFCPNGVPINGSFEDWTSESPTGWLPFSGTIDKVTDAYEGDIALAGSTDEGTFFSIRSPVTIEPDSCVELSLYGRKGGGGVVLANETGAALFWDDGNFAGLITKVSSSATEWTPGSARAVVTNPSNSGSSAYLQLSFADDEVDPGIARYEFDALCLEVLAPGDCE